MANPGVIILASERLNGVDRMDVEDNIGEGVHIHYKNLRLDLSVDDLMAFCRACKEAVDELGKKN